MNVDTLIGFSIASFLFLVIPGPVTLLVVLNGVQTGFKNWRAIAGGIVLGDAIAMGVSLTGLGALLITNPSAIEVLRLLGGGILISLGLLFVIKLRRGERAPASNPTQSIGGFSHALALTALHPGGYVFFAALFSIFVDANYAFAPQLGMLAGIYLIIAALTVTFWMGVGAFIGHADYLRPAMPLFNLISGLVLVLIGLASIFIH